MFVYDDYRGWGREFQLVCNDAILFSQPAQIPDDSFVFFPVGHDMNYRRTIKVIAEEINKKTRIWPNIQEIRMYDDKIAQYMSLKKWCPQSWIMETEEQARVVMRDISFPFVSKSREGSGASNVDYIDCVQLARLQVKAAFNGGIPRLQHIQQGYLFWQKFILDNPYTWRVVVIDKRFAFSHKKYINKDVPFASCTDNIKITEELDDEVIEVMDFALKFCIENDMVCEGVDIMKDGNDYKVLEVHCSWGWPGLVADPATCPIYEKKDRWSKTKYTEDTKFWLFNNEVFCDYN